MSAFLSHKLKLIFPHIPRTGGTSLTEFIEPFLGPDAITDGQFEKHQSLRTIKQAHPKEFELYTVFAVVRHPFDRLASLIQGYRPKMTLAQLMSRLKAGIISKNEAFFWSAQRWLCDINGENLADEVFKLEDGLD